MLIMITYFQAVGDIHLSEEQEAQGETETDPQFTGARQRAGVLLRSSRP